MASSNEQSAFGTFESEELSLTLLARTSPVEALTKIYAISVHGEDEDADEDHDTDVDVEINGDELEELDGDVVQGVKLDLVHSEGGGEGGGEYVERVYALIEHSTGETLSFVRQTGSYYSHDGIYWDGELEQVFPHQVMVTEYRTER